MKKPFVRFAHLRALFFIQRLKASFHASEKQSPSAFAERLFHLSG
jgi:hypothetical protein